MISAPGAAITRQKRKVFAFSHSWICICRSPMAAPSSRRSSPSMPCFPPISHTWRITGRERIWSTSPRCGKLSSCWCPALMSPPSMCQLLFKVFFLEILPQFGVVEGIKSILILFGLPWGFVGLGCCNQGVLLMRIIACTEKSPIFLLCLLHCNRYK